MVLTERIEANKILSAVNMLKVSAHPVRLAIVDLLTENKKMTVLEIQEALNLAQAIASQHLTLLEDKGVLLSEKRNGKTIGIVGLGKIGKKIATIAAAFDMNVIAWSSNLTEEKANEGGARLVSKETLFKEADFITVHLVLSERTKAIIKSADLALMKTTAYIINTSRGPLIAENDLVQVLQNNKIAGAALDVFDQEPLPADHPFRTLPNVLATPHIGYVTQNTYKLFFDDTVNIISNWIASNK